ncbi:pilus assembly protein [Novosphingobium sp. G106]|uniref:TadE/TadG family type IV pilus assembly protein n=1 Tax=Novosphingobium sp. G106 TaxID=2849500 RepID=UPI001C2D5D80|nr:TadE family protein [Novosphingobium sp. G106]MBV1689334.1 pilus assembly protein [Novosphingobium sp. G106]
MTRPATRHWKWLASFRRDTSGASAAEFALVVPVFILLTFGTVSAGVLLSAITQMHFAAEKAARCLSVDVAGNCPTGAIDAYAKTFYNGPAVTGLTFTRTSPAPSCGNQITASGTYQFITGFSSTSVNLSSSACYPLI